MGKYKQKYIPVVETPREWKDLHIQDLRRIVKDFYLANIQGTDVINIDRGFKITFSGQGRQKLVRGSAMYSRKAAVVFILRKLLEVAEYSNFGKRKATDPVVLMGYLNFKAKCIIDGRNETIRLACMLYSTDKIYFNHEVNIIRKGVKTYQGHRMRS